MRDQRLQVRMSKQEIDLIAQAAELASMNISEFTRLMLLIGSRGTLELGPDKAQEIVRQSSFMLFGRMVPRSEIEGLDMKEDTD